MQVVSAPTAANRERFFTEEVEIIRPRYAVILVSACALLLSNGKLRLLAQTIKFEVPAVVDPIHTNGEPDIAMGKCWPSAVLTPNSTCRSALAHETPQSARLAS